MRIEKTGPDLRRRHQSTFIFPCIRKPPAEGRALQDLFGTGPEDIAAKNARMAGLMAAEGLPYSSRSHTYTTAGWHRNLGPGPIASLAERHFMTPSTRRISSIAVTLVISTCWWRSPAPSVSMKTKRAPFSLSGACKDAVDADWAKSRQYGVTGVPTFVAGKTGVVGAQPYETLEQLVEGGRRSAPDLTAAGYHRAVCEPHVRAAQSGVGRQRADLFVSVAFLQCTEVLENIQRSLESRLSNFDMRRPSNQGC